MRKRKKKNENKNKIVLLIIALLLMIILGSCCCYKYFGSKNITDYEKEVDAITEIDNSKQQEALNAIVDKGKMNVNYSSKAVFDGLMSEKFNIKNISNNHDSIVFELYDEEGECIYTSKKIEPGYEMNRIELQKELSEGKHQCKLKVGYATEGNVSSVFPIMVEVR